MRTWVEGTPQRIVVFRASMLGELLCAVPALRALKTGFASADITLVGLPWARALAQRIPYVDEFMAFPGHPGLPEAECDDVRALPDFLAQVQARRFDLAVQLQGSGAIINPLVASFGARRSAGFATPGDWVPDDDIELYCEWPDRGHEIERLLTLTDHLGVPRRGNHLEFPLDDADRHALRALWPDAGARPYACVHAGAQMPTRRWHPRRYAEVGDVLADRGFTVVLTGSPAEAGLVSDVAACMQHTPLNLGGHTTLWTLGALIEGAAVVVCNDTGVSHIAAALGRPSVVVSCGSDASRWSPPDRVLHRVLAQPMQCRPCRHFDCPTAHECATSIEVPQVLRWLPQRAPQRTGVTA